MGRPGRCAPANRISLTILDSIHARWDAVYQSLTPEQFQRTFFHPEMQEVLTLERHLQLYAWHSKHHVAHITSLRRREQWPAPEVR